MTSSACGLLLEEQLRVIGSRGQVAPLDGPHAGVPPEDGLVFVGRAERARTLVAVHSRPEAVEGGRGAVAPAKESSTFALPRYAFVVQALVGVGQTSDVVPSFSDA